MKDHGSCFSSQTHRDLDWSSERRASEAGSESSSAYVLCVLINDCHRQTHTHTHTDSHTVSHTVSLTHTHTHTHTHTQTDRHTQTQTHTQTDRHTRTHSLSLTHTHTQTDRLTHTVSLTHTHTHTHTQTDRHTHRHTQTDRHTRTHSLSLTHTHTLTHSLTHTLTCSLTHTHTQSVLIMLCVCVCVCAAYGGPLIEHCLAAVGLPGLCRVDSQADVTQGKHHQHVNRRDCSLEQMCVVMLSWRSRRNQTMVLSFAVSPRVLEALQMAEDYMEKTSSFSGQVSVCPERVLSCVSLVIWTLVCPLSGLHHSEEREEAQHESRRSRGRAADVRPSEFITLLSSYSIMFLCTN